MTTRRSPVTGHVGVSPRGVARLWSERSPRPVEVSGYGWFAMSYAIRLTADQEDSYAALGCGAEFCVHHHKALVFVPQHRW